MDEKKKLGVLWVILAALLVGGSVLASQVSHLSLRKDWGPADVTKLLTTFFVLALFVERTLEVFITAWRGQASVKGEGELQAANQALAQDPANQARKDKVQETKVWLAQYKCETQAIALRSGLVLGILIAAVGVRSFNTLVDGPDVTQAAEFWPSIRAELFNVLDVLVSGGIIGGGSDAIHKMMNIITEFFDATAKKVKNS